MSVALILFFGLLILLLISVPVSFALGIAAAMALLVEGSTPLLQIIQRMLAGSSSWLLLAIPFFMLTGEIMEKGGVTRRLVDFADALVGFRPAASQRLTLW
jgi:C4-dicarboxylate transporter DctM subunit